MPPPRSRAAHSACRQPLSHKSSRQRTSCHSFSFSNSELDWKQGSRRGKKFFGIFHCDRVRATSEQCDIGLWKTLGEGKRKQRWKNDVFAPVQHAHPAAD